MFSASPSRGSRDSSGWALLEVDKSAFGLWRGERAVFLSAKPLVSIYCNPVVYPITKANRDGFEDSKQWPGKPQLSGNAERGG